MRRQITQRVDQPAPGVDYSFVPSTTERVKLLSVCAAWQPTVASDNRVPALQLSDQNDVVYWMAGSNQFLGSGAPAIVTWSFATQIWAIGQAYGGQPFNAPLPDLWLEPGDTVTSVTAALQPGDQWSNIVWRGLIDDAWERRGELAAIARVLRR